MYTFPLSHFVSAFQIYRMYEWFIFIIYDVRRDALFSRGVTWNHDKITFIDGYFNVLGHRGYRYYLLLSWDISATIRIYPNNSHLSGFCIAFVFVYFSFLLEFILCWCVHVFGKGGGWDFSCTFFVPGSEISAKEKNIQFYTSHKYGQKLIFNI